MESKRQKVRMVTERPQFDYVLAFGMTLDEILEGLAKITGIDIARVDQEIAAGIEPGWRKNFNLSA